MVWTRNIRYGGTALSVLQLDEEDKKKVHIVEALIGSKEWISAIQENILDQRSICFGCGQEITFKSDFFYMTGRRGIVMLHHDCFQPFSRDIRRVKEGDNAATLPPGEWLTIEEVSQFAGVGYMAIYQRIVSGALPAEKRQGKWFIPRKAVERMGPGRLLPGPRLSPKDLSPKPKKRAWHSEVTEPIKRMSMSEAARKIGVSRTWVSERKDQFEAIKIDGEWRLSCEAVDNFIKNEEQGATG